MNHKNWSLFLVTLALIGGTAFGLNRLRTHQRLGAPGIKSSPIAGSRRLNLYLPQYVLDYNSIIVPTDKEVLRGLPQDTSFIQRHYLSSSSNELLLNIVLMGTDRTSIHKPQFCLTGSGWNIDGGESAPDTLRVESPHPYDLPVMKLLTSREVNDQGKPVTQRGIYVYWFVADNDLTSDHWTRMRNMATHLLRTGELERWAYVSCFAECWPGQENATYERMKQFITASVPKFQLATNPRVAYLDSFQTAAR